MSDSSVRVNLTVPSELDAVLQELSACTGRGKASYAVEALTWYLPHLRRLLRELRISSGEPGPRMESSAEARTAPRPGVAVPVQRQAEGGGVRLSRKERRALERQARKQDRRTTG